MVQTVLSSSEDTDRRVVGPQPVTITQGDASSFARGILETSCWLSRVKCFFLFSSSGHQRNDAWTSRILVGASWGGQGVYHRVAFFFAAWFLPLGQQPRMSTQAGNRPGKRRCKLSLRPTWPLRRRIGPDQATQHLPTSKVLTRLSDRMCYVDGPLVTGQREDRHDRLHGDVKLDATRSKYSTPA